MTEEPEQTGAAEAEPTEPQPADVPEAAQPSAAAAESQPPQERLSPKERRQRVRSARAARRAPRAPQSPEERRQEREAERRRKALARRQRRQREREKARGSRREVEPTAPRAHGSGVQKTRQGVVVSDRAEKTITVRIDIARRHRRYEKIVHTTRTVHAHDERGDAHMGDTVIVRESRPLSRTKRWRLVEVVQRAE